MVIETPIGRSTSFGDGQTTDFLLGFKIQSLANLPPEDILGVYIFENGEQRKLILGVDYDITLDPDTVVFFSAPAPAALITFLLQPLDVQQIEYQIGGAFQVKSHEGALDYIQRTNIKQSDILGRSPTLFESAKPQELVNPVGQGGFVVGVSSDEDAWEMYPPEDLGPVIPPDMELPESLNRSLIISSFTDKKVVFDTMPFGYIPGRSYIHCLTNLWISGILSIIQDGLAHTITFATKTFNIHFNFDGPGDLPVIDNYLYATFTAGIWNFSSKILEVVVRDLDIEESEILLATSTSAKPLELRGSGIKRVDDVIVSNAPISTKDYLEIDNATTKNTITFTSGNGDYGIAFNIERSATQGVLIFITTGNTTQILPFEADFQNIVSHPNSTVGAIPLVDDNTINVVYKDSPISSLFPEEVTISAEQIFYAKNVSRETLAEGKLEGFVQVTYSEDCEDYQKNYTGDGFLQKVGGIISTENANPNGVDWPDAVENTIPYATSDTIGGDVTLGNSTITFDPTGTFISVSGASYLSTLFINDHGLMLTSDLDIDPSSLLTGTSAAGFEFISEGVYKLIPFEADLDEVVTAPDPLSLTFIPKSIGDREIASSNISDDGSLITLDADADVTGNLSTITFDIDGREITTTSKLEFTPTQTGIGFWTEIATGEFELSTIDIPEGAGDVIYPSPTDNFIPKVGDAGTKSLVNSSLFDDGTTVNIDARLTIADQGTADPHEISFIPDVDNEIIFGDMTLGGVVLADYDTNVTTLRAIGTVEGIGDVVYPTPTLGAIPFVNNAGGKELADSSLFQNPDESISVATPLIVDSTLLFNDGTSHRELSLETGNPSNINFNITEAGSLKATEDNGTFIIEKGDTFDYPGATADFIPMVNEEGDGFTNSPILHNDGNVSLLGDLSMVQGTISLVAGTLSMLDGTLSMIGTASSASFGGTLRIAGKGLSFTEESEAFEIDAQEEGIAQIVDVGGKLTLTHSSLIEDEDAITSSKPIVSKDYIGVEGTDINYRLSFSDLVVKNHIFNIDKSGTLSAVVAGDQVIISAGAGGDGDGDVALPIPEEGRIVKVSSEEPKELASSLLRDDGTDVTCDGMFVANIADQDKPAVVLASQNNRGLMFYQDVDNTTELKIDSNRGKFDIVFDFDENVVITDGLIEGRVSLVNGRITYFLDLIPKALEDGNVFFEDNDQGILADGGSLTALQSYDQNAQQSIWQEKPSMERMDYDNTLRVTTTLAKQVHQIDEPTFTFDFDSANFFEIQLTGDVELILPDLSTHAKFITIVISTASAGNSSKITWTGNILWEGGEPFLADFLSPISPVSIEITFIWTKDEYIAYLNSDFRLSASGRTMVYQGDFEAEYIINQNTGVQYIATPSALIGSLDQPPGGTFTYTLFNVGYQLTTFFQRPPIEEPTGEFAINIEGGFVTVPLGGDIVIKPIATNFSNRASSAALFIERSAVGDFSITFENMLISEKDSAILSEDVGEVDAFEIIYNGVQFFVSRVNQREEEEAP